MSDDSIDSETQASHEPDARRRLEDREVRSRIERILSGLSAQQRAAFILHHYENEPLKSIADTLHCSVGTVKTHIYRAVRVLRKNLSDYANKESER